MWEKLANIDNRILYLFVVLCLIIPIIKPIGMPVSINKDLTLPFYEFIDSLSEGDVVLFDISYSASNDTELTPMVKAVMEHCANKGVKIVVAGQWESGLYFTESIIENKAEELGLVYGEDWVNIGFKAGGTATWRLMRTKFWEGAMGRDINDVSFEDLPLMHRIQGIDPETFAAIICFTSGSPGDGTWITYFPDIPLLTGQVAVQVASRIRYLQTGQMKGLLAGMRGAAEYEQLIGHLDVATKLMDAQTLSHLLVIFFIVLGNIGYLASKRQNARAGY